MSESDNSETIVAFESCTVALPTVLADIDGLLALVYNITTKLSLAVKTSQPSYSTTMTLLKDLVHPIAALTHASTLLSDEIHGATLVNIVRTHLAQIIEALHALMQTLLAIAAPDPPTTDAPADEYLLRTGILHELITSARGIPKDNRSAVHISWKSDAESLDDNLQEVAKLIDQAETPADQEDGWDEIGLGGTSRLNNNELARAKNVHRLLRLTTLLHNRVSLDLLPYPSSAPVSAFDPLTNLSNQLLSTSDDLVAELYTPQDLPTVREVTLQITDIATSLQSQITTLLLAVDPLSDQLGALSLDGATAQPSKKKRADKKWFDTCVDQILRLCTAVTESTNQPDNL